MNAPTPARPERRSGPDTNQADASVEQQDVDPGFEAEPEDEEYEPL
jgi:hypothetical protein